MKNLLILLGLALFTLVGCDSPNNTLGSKGRISASETSNGDWKFDLTGLGVITDNRTTWYLSYSTEKNGNTMTSISIEEGHDENYNGTGKYTASAYFTLSDGTEESIEGIAVDMNNPMVVTITGSKGLFNKANAKWAYVSIGTDTADGSKEKGASYEGAVTNGSGELTMIAKGGSEQTPDPDDED